MSDQPTVPISEPQRDRDFIALYANNVAFEASAWDLKINFGQLDQRGSPAVMREHTAIIIPWAQAKLAVYWLQLQIAIHELETGKIPIRKDLIPPPPERLTEAETNPDLQRFFEIANKLHRDFVATL